MSTQDIIATIDGALDDWRTGPDAMRWSKDPGAAIAAGPPMPDPTAMFRAFAEACKPLQRMLTQMSREFQNAGRALHPLLVKAGVVEGHRMARCRTCSPMANPLPLPFNGAEYHRRSRRR